MKNPTMNDDVEQYYSPSGAMISCTDNTTIATTQMDRWVKLTDYEDDLKASEAVSKTFQDLTNLQRKEKIQLIDTLEKMKKTQNDMRSLLIRWRNSDSERDDLSSSEYEELYEDTDKLLSKTSQGERNES